MANNTSITGGPQKQDIENVFHKLRSMPMNKACFDCNVKNPTWASVTYGVFICIDCSAVHRSLGVHLTFVRSTNLDTNWTWIQLRQMQLGGNANAAQFFRQHNCNTTDAQQKYNSRAAQLYRDKLNAAAQNVMKIHGTKLHLDSAHETENSQNDQEEDFFAECHNDNNDFLTNNVKNNNYESVSEVKIQPKEEKQNQEMAHNISGAPCVDFLNSSVSIDSLKPTIGIRKIQPKKGLGLTKKGGLGATKVKTNFADVEQKAHLADQQKINVPEKKLTQEEEAETIASVRLAYQDLSIQANKEKEKLKRIDPAKAKQMERLGMGFNLKTEISHSALSDMKTINQNTAPKSNTKPFDKEPVGDFYDFFTPYSLQKHDPDLDAMGFETIEPIESNSKISTMFSPVTVKTPSASLKNSSITEQVTSRHSSKVTSGGTKYNTYETEEAQKKFGTAKAISSDQFFNNESSSLENSANLAKFQGSNSISSADYFGESTNRKPNRGLNYSAPDLDEVRESVRQGVTKVAGRLSSLASDMMSSLQDKYGG